MSTAEVRTQIYLPKRLHRQLREAAARRGVSMAELLREGAEVILARARDAGPLDELVGAVTHGPRDISEMHDRHLYGRATGRRRTSR